MHHQKLVFAFPPFPFDICAYLAVFWQLKSFFTGGLIMKKVTAMLMITAVFSTTVFAAPLSTVGSWDLRSQEVFSTELSSGSLPDSDDLFSGITSVQLTDAEAEAVEGEGLFGTIFACVTAAATIAISVVDLVQGDTDAAASHLISGMALAGTLATVVVP
jgi:hypothetical protein